MKITLNQDPSYPETEVIINCPQADEELLRLVAMLRIYQRKRGPMSARCGCTSWRRACGSWTLCGRGARLL